MLIFCVSQCLLICCGKSVLDIHQNHHQRNQMERWSDVRIFDVIMTIYISHRIQFYDAISYHFKNLLSGFSQRSVQYQYGFLISNVFNANHRREFQTISFHNAFNLICNDFRHHCSIRSFVRLTLEPFYHRWFRNIVLRSKNMSKFSIHIFDVALLFFSFPQLME